MPDKICAVLLKFTKLIDNSLSKSGIYEKFLGHLDYPSPLAFSYILTTFHFKKTVYHVKNDELPHVAVCFIVDVHAKSMARSGRSNPTSATFLNDIAGLICTNCTDLKYMLQ